MYVYDVPDAVTCDHAWSQVTDAVSTETQMKQNMIMN